MDARTMMIVRCEAFLKRKYVLPVAVLHPFVASSLALVYLGDGRFDLPKDPAVLDVTALSQAALDHAEIQQSSPTESVPMRSALTLVVTHASTMKLEPQQGMEDANPASHGASEAMPLSTRGRLSELHWRASASLCYKVACGFGYYCPSACFVRLASPSRRLLLPRIIRRHRSVKQHRRRRIRCRRRS
ncbi:MAG TPA: hypothetical protein VGM02_05730 [Acidobacteriaceae bacterium]